VVGRSFIILFSFLAQFACAEPFKNIEHVYFGTTREVVEVEGQLKPLPGRSSGIHLGEADVLFDEGYRPHDPSHIKTTGGRLMTQEEFNRVAGPSLQDSKDIVIFIHGFYNSFSDSIKTASQIKSDQNIDGQVLAFSWPSAGSALSYISDETEAINAQNGKALRKFIEIILAKAQGKRVHLIAHSMGNRILLAALQAYTEAHGNLEGIQNVVFVAPDEEQRAFKIAMKGLIMKSGNTDFTLYVNPDDPALKASHQLHDKVSNTIDTRTGSLNPEQSSLFGFDIFAGNQKERALLKQKIMNHFHIIDASNLNKSGHSYFRDQSEVVEDLSNVFHGRFGGPNRSYRKDAAELPYYVLLRSLLK
jgi:esterase/lipase superfamily enzyme